MTSKELAYKQDLERMEEALLKIEPKLKELKESDESRSEGKLSTFFLWATINALCRAVFHLLVSGIMAEQKKL